MCQPRKKNGASMMNGSLSAMNTASTFVLRQADVITFARANSAIFKVRDFACFCGS